jgi:dienelactone hydrolase
LCLPIEKATWCRFLFINGEDDRAIPWEHGRNLHERCAVFPGKSRHIVYPNAGHVIDPPYNPPNQSRWLKGLKVALNYGGTLEGHAHAQEQSWRETLAFFARELTVDTKL